MPWRGSGTPNPKPSRAHSAELSLRRARLAPYAFLVACSTRASGSRGADSDVTGPSWLAVAFAAVMIGIALYCAGRLALSRLRRRETEFDADGLHVAMGVAMAGMLVPRLSPPPGSRWEGVFPRAAG